MESDEKKKEEERKERIKAAIKESKFYARRREGRKQGYIKKARER